MVKKDTKKKIALGTAAAAVAGGAAAMAHPKVRKAVGDKAKDMKDEIQDKM